MRHRFDHPGGSVEKRCVDLHAHEESVNRSAGHDVKRFAAVKSPPAHQSPKAVKKTCGLFRAVGEDSPVARVDHSERHRIRSTPCCDPWLARCTSCWLRLRYRPTRATSRACAPSPGAG